MSDVCYYESLGAKNAAPPWFSSILKQNNFVTEVCCISWAISQYDEPFLAVSSQLDLLPFTAVPVMLPQFSVYQTKLTQHTSGSGNIQYANSKKLEF